MQPRLRGLLRRPLLLSAAVALCALSYLGLMTSVLLFAWAFGAVVQFSHIAVLLPPVLVASMLPVTLGGWGTRELAMVAALGIVGISADAAILTSVWLGLASIIVVLPGAAFLVGRPVDLRAVRAGEREA